MAYPRSSNSGRRGRARAPQQNYRHDSEGDTEERAASQASNKSSHKSSPKSHHSKTAIHSAPEGPTFAGFLKKKLGIGVGVSAEPRSGAQVAEPLAGLSYTQELQFKNEALREFWQAVGLPDKPNLLVASPKPRGYRTTSKRRLSWVAGEARFDFKPEGRTPGAARLGAASELEPEAHARIFEFTLAKLNTPAYAQLTRAMNFLVIRGDYEKFAVILNVQRTSADIVRKAKLLAAQFEREPGLGVVSAWLFQGAGQSPFYLDQSAPNGQWKSKRLFGPEQFAIAVGDSHYDFHPLGFSQVNLSLLPRLIADTLEALKCRREERLIDLYCGYGLFSLAAAPQVAEVIGIDAAERAIPAARAMASARKFNHARFLRDTLHARSLEKLLPPPGDKPEIILLDPPKAGSGVGVIRSIAARAPRRVVQLFCGMDALVKDCDAWRRAGYMLAKAVPYDMFPGTDEIEMLAVFVPDKFGLLNRTPPPAHVQPHAELDPRPEKPSRRPHPRGRRPR